MRWFRQKVTEEKSDNSAVTLAAPSAWLLELFGSTSTLSGASVTPESALRVPAVRAAVEAISTTCGTLPVKLYERQGNAKDVARDHPAHRLAHDDANPFTTAARFRQQLTADALLHGNGFAFVNRVGGFPRELLRLDPRAVSVEINVATGEPVYVLQAANGRTRYTFRDFLHLPCPLSTDGFTGLSPIVTAREAVALALVLEEHAARLFGNGARPSGILKTPARLTAEAAARIRDSWNTAHAGANTGKTAVLEEGMTFETIALNAVDTQFEQMRRFQLEEISRAFRVAPVFLSEFGRATWSNSEEMARQFLSFTMLPWLREWEGALRRALLSPDERDTYSVEFVVDDLLRADTATRANAYSQFRAMGVMTANEVRARENLPSLAGGDALANPFTSTPNGAPANDRA
ncbi:MAG: phage portal protein [Salinarimonas sp.]